MSTVQFFNGSKKSLSKLGIVECRHFVTFDINAHFPVILLQQDFASLHVSWYAGAFITSLIVAVVGLLLHCLHMIRIYK